MSIAQIAEAEYQICRNITFISEEQIVEKHWIDALALVVDVDGNDIHYIAYSKQFRYKLWPGDKKLTNGLAKKGYTNIINTDDLYKLRQKRIKPI